MRIADIPTRVTPWADLSRQALAAAQDQQRAAESFALLQQLADRWPQSLAEIAMGWIDVLAAAQGIEEYRPDLPVRTDVDFVTVEQFVNPRPPTAPEQWAFDLIRARMTWDQRAYLALFTTAWENGTLSAGLQTLLHLIGYTLVWSRAQAEIEAS